MVEIFITGECVYIFVLQFFYLIIVENSVFETWLWIGIWNGPLCMLNCSFHDLVDNESTF